MKKPNVLGRPELHLEDAKVFEHAFNYAIDVRHKHGAQLPFALVTTVTHWTAVLLEDACSRNAVALDRIDHIDGSCNLHPANVSGRRSCASDFACYSEWFISAQEMSRSFFTYLSTLMTAPADIYTRRRHW